MGTERTAVYKGERQNLNHSNYEYKDQSTILRISSHFNPFKEEAQTASFKDPVRTAL